MNRLNKACHVCGSGVVKSVVDREMRQFSFERIEFSCGVTLETHFTANGNVGRAILCDCGNAE